MRLSSTSFAADGPIPARFALGRPASPAQFSDNVSPHLAFSDTPTGTRSLALLCHDPDVPSRPDDVNQTGRTVPHDLPRVDFFHWVLIDIPPTVTHLPEGSHAHGFVPRGKPPGPAVIGVQGVNDYTGWFADDPALAGEYGGYDGPFPPWNDTRIHHYVFTAFALDVASLGLHGAFTGQDVRKAMVGHVIQMAELVGTYHIFADAR